MNTKQDILYTLTESNLFLNDVSIQDDKEYQLGIRDLPREEKPKEKLIKYGPSVLSSSELLSVVLGVGTRKEEVSAMTRRILREYGEKAIVDQINPKQIMQQLDIPLGKSCQIVACFELGRRFFGTTKGKPIVVRTAKQVSEYVNDMRTLSKECLRGLYLNNHYQLVHDEVIAIGSVDGSLAHPREIFRPALEHAASAVILVHNHPSGNSKPSTSDITVTRQLIEAGNIIGISLLDHIIVTEKDHVSILPYVT